MGRQIRTNRMEARALRGKLRTVRHCAARALCRRRSALRWLIGTRGIPARALGRVGRTRRGYYRTFCKVTRRAGGVPAAALRRVTRAGRN